MTAAAWLHGKVKVGLPDGAELRCTSEVDPVCETAGAAC
jgi:hypothetical protein